MTDNRKEWSRYDYYELCERTLPPWKNESNVPLHKNINGIGQIDTEDVLWNSNLILDILHTM
jgi:hypothetical protein